VSVAVEAIDMDPGDLGKLTYSVSNSLFAIQQDVNRRTATIVVRGSVLRLLLTLQHSTVHNCAVQWLILLFSSTVQYYDCIPNSICCIIVLL